MNAAEVSAALVAWAEATCPELADHGYSYPPVGKTKDLPDVVAGVLRESEMIRDPERFPWSQIQQTGIRVFECGLSLMVDQGDTGELTDAQREAAAETATNLLRTMTRALLDAKRADPTLGGRVHDTAPEASVDYEPGFVEYADGTRGREARVNLDVGEPLHQPV